MLSFYATKILNMLAEYRYPNILPNKSYKMLKMVVMSRDLFILDARHPVFNASFVINFVIEIASQCFFIFLYSLLHFLGISCFYKLCEILFINLLINFIHDGWQDLQVEYCNIPKEQNSLL